MCETCWQKYGSPQHMTRRVRALARLMDRVGDVGGGLHVVLDDWNLEDEHLDFCATQPLTGDERTCLNAMRRASVADRASALALCEGYYGDKGMRQDYLYWRHDAQ